jgi:hypothetical protein
MILLLLATASDPDLLLRNARTLLAAACQEAECATRPDTRFRVTGEQGDTVTSKDRAIRDDGSRCNVVGARRCTKRGRTLFRADLDL